ncbi:MAG: hypothetical protein ACT4NY_07830 [Pseudonocardiales bacterium]
MAIRRRGTQPPIPTGFGTVDAEWSTSAEHDPVLVAALNLHHLVVRGFIDQARGDPAQLLVDRLGTSLRTAQRLLSGRQLFSLPEIVELASLTGNELFRHLPTDVIDFFPAKYRQYLAGWQAGRHRLPAFSPPAGVDDVHWGVVARALHQWITDETEFHRGPLIAAEVVVHQLASCLAEAGIASDLVLPQRELSLPTSWAALQLITKFPCLLAVAWLPDTGDDPAEQLADAIGGFHRLVAGPRPVVVILAVGTRFLAQLQLHLPTLVTANPDDKVNIPLEIAGRIGALQPATTATPDLDLTVIFRSSPTSPTLILFRVGKT